MGLLGDSSLAGSLDNELVALPPLGTSLLHQGPFLKMGSSQPDFNSGPPPPPPPPLGSVAIHHLPVLHEFKTQQFRHLLPQHSHNNIAVGPSFSLYNKASWFSSLFPKLAAGCYNVHGPQ